jgi:hypothetical protein
MALQHKGLLVNLLSIVNCASRLLTADCRLTLRSVQVEERELDHAKAESAQRAVANLTAAQQAKRDAQRSRCAHSVAPLASQGSSNPSSSTCQAGAELQQTSESVLAVQ